MTEAEIAEMTAKYTLWGIIIGAVITSVIGAAVLAWLTRRFNRSHANEQVDRDLRLHRATLTHNNRTAAYDLLDEWLSAVTDRSDDICFTHGVAVLPQGDPTAYDVCVAMYQGPLRLPTRGRYLWSQEVAQRVREVQRQAEEMAQLVRIEGFGPDDEHGHDELEEVADMLRQAMSDHLEGRERHLERVPQPHSGQWWSRLMGSTAKRPESVTDLNTSQESSPISSLPNGPPTVFPLPKITRCRACWPGPILRVLRAIVWGGREGRRRPGWPRTGVRRSSV